MLKKKKKCRELPVYYVKTGRYAGRKTLIRALPALHALFLAVELL